MKVINDYGSHVTSVGYRLSNYPTSATRLNLDVMRMLTVYLKIEL